MANEGRFVAFVPQRDAPAALKVSRRNAVSAEAGVIGAVAKGTAGLVTLKSLIGVTRVLDMLSGEQLPRIC